MKRVFSLVVISLLCLSMFTMFAPKASASSDLLSLPAAPYGWQYSDSSHNTLMVNPLAGPLVSVSEQSISASPGQTVTVSVTYQVFAQSPPNNPSEIDQLFFVESWTTSWPPQGYTIPLYNGIPGLSPGVTQTNTISFTVPSVGGTYYLWLCFEAQYSMQDAVNQRAQSMTGLPGHIKVVVTPPAAPVGYWKFDEGSGTVASDSSGNGNTGTVNGAQWVDGVEGKALKFDGIDDYVYIPNSPSLDISGNEISVEYWVNFPRGWYPGIPISGDYTHGHIVFDKGDAYTACFYDTSGTHIFNIPGVPPLCESNKNTWDANTWYHFANVFDGSQIRTYVNGVLDKAETAIGSVSRSSINLAIGSHCYGGMRFFEGIIDEFAIYNYARTAEEIQSDYAQGGAPSSDLLLLPAAPYGWQYSDSSHNALMTNPLAGPLISVSEQTIVASPGQTVSISVTYQVFVQSPPNNPGEIDQLFFAESWTTGWPPQGYTIPLYNGMPGLSPGVTQTSTISFTVPSVGGTYYLWLCFEAQYSMQDAVNQRTQSMTGLPGHIKIVVTPALADSLVGYWKFDEGVGGTASDSSGNGNTGIVDGAQWVDGVREKALRFDGVDDYVYIPHSSSLDLDGYHMSVEFWMKLGLDWYPGIVHENMCVYDKGDAYTSSLIASSGALCYNLAYIPPRQTPETTKNSWAANTWFFIAEVYDDPYIRIYVNGVLDHSELVSGPIPHSGFNLCIGAHSLRIAQVWFNGVIDEFKIYNYARTAEEIQSDARALRAWKDDSSLGLENDRLYLHGLAATGNYKWFFDYLVFKDTGTTWYQPWGELAILVYPNFQPNYVSTTDFEVNAFTEADKAYLQYSITSGNLKEELTYTIYPGEPYVNVTLSVTSVGSTTENTYAGVQFTTWIAGDYANDYYFVPGYGQGQFTGSSGNIYFTGATEKWVAEWDQNKGEGCGILSTKGFTPSNIVSEDFGNGEGFKFISDNFDLQPGQTSTVYDCYLNFFTGTGWQQTKDFYDSLTPQCQITFDQTGLGSDFTGTVVTIDGTNYGVSDLPKVFQWNQDSTHGFSYASPLGVSGHEQYVWASTTGLSTLQSDTLTVAGSGNVTANYVTQYSVTFGQVGVGSDFLGTVATIDGTNYNVSSLPFSFWWDNGSTHSFAFQSPLLVGSGETEYDWASTSGLSTLQSGSITVTGSGSVVGNYVTSVHDVAVTSVTANRTWVYQGLSANVTVTVLNKGDFVENATVTLYYNITANDAAGIQNVTLAPGQNQTIIFVWNTTGVPYCLNYTMTGVASIPADNYPTDNTLAGGTIKVRILGDVNGDDKVDIGDVAIAAKAFGSHVGWSRWNPDADVNGDGKIDIQDIALIAKNFGKHCP